MVVVWEVGGGGPQGAVDLFRVFVFVSGEGQGGDASSWRENYTAEFITQPSSLIKIESFHVNDVSASVSVGVSVDVVLVLLLVVLLVLVLQYLRS